MLSDLEKKLKSLYDSFCGEMDINTTTGIVGDSSIRFSGAPYVGSRYENAKSRILFIGMDIGADEQFHDFGSRRNEISHTDRGFTEIPAKSPFNPHIYGTYAMSLALLNNIYGWDSIWNQFSSDLNRTACEAIKAFHKIIPVELLDYVSLTNTHKFVTIDRQNRTGDMDRYWQKEELEIDLLKKEVEIFDPEVIVIQSLGLSYLRDTLTIPSERVIVSAHPAARSRHYRSIGYITSLVNEFLNR